MTLIYPKSSRMDSSNYDPNIAWAVGAQIASINYKTFDKFKRIYDSKFRQNGSCGYVLKPEYMWMSPPRGFVTVPIRLTIHIISGQQLPKPGGKLHGEIIDPFVQIIVEGAHEDVKMQKTRVIDNNGFNPVWDEFFRFDIQNPDAAIIELAVYDYSFGDRLEFIAHSGIPLVCIRPGLRHVSLYDKYGMRDGDFEFASLLVRIGIEGI